MEIKFFVRILGALTPPPTIDEPVRKIPLKTALLAIQASSYPYHQSIAYHAAPTTDNPIHRAIPRVAQTYGDTDSRNWPT